MGIIIRDDIEQYMKELKKWLEETEDADLEEMGAFFTARIDEYENHMSIWEKAYQRVADLIPSGCSRLLDLGCGTGLELDAIWKMHGDIEVTGVDLCQGMLEQLVRKHSDKALTVVCEDYFQYDMGTDTWETVVSFESLHHFFPEQKGQIYTRIYKALKDGGMFILGDYIACCKEEEEILRSSYLEKRKKSDIPDGQFVHFDIPLTLEHEIKLLKMAGFSYIGVSDSIRGATIICAKK